VAALKLKTVLETHKVAQRALAQPTGLSPASVTQIVTHGRWPKRADRAQIREAILQVLRERGVPEVELEGVFEPATTGKARARKAAPTAEKPKEETDMLLRKQGLFPETKTHFGLFMDPFGQDLRSNEDVYLSTGIRYVREAMYHVARHGGMLAVLGESGSGKSTLRRDLIGRIIAQDDPVKVIEPYVLGMEDNDKTGRTLRAMHIAEAIMAAVAPHKHVHGSPEARFHQLHDSLRDSSRAGNHHCLIIEEAHGLSTPTIKHLKRFMELEDGFRKLISVILIAQPELQQRLSEGNHEVREVVQRCEVVELKALNGDLDQYLKFKVARAGGDLDKIITPAGIEALRTKLTGPAGRGGARDRVSYCYPLAVGNMLIAAMNQAADIGAPIVDEKVILSV